MHFEKGRAHNMAQMSREKPVEFLRFPSITLVDSKCYSDALLPDHGECLVGIDKWGANGHTNRRSS